MEPKCCEETPFIDFSKMGIPDLEINFQDRNLWITFAIMTFCPVYWNILARWEYHTHALTRMFGSARLGCVALALSILLLSLFRDYRYKLALASQPRWYYLECNSCLYFGYALGIIGFIFVSTSYLSLGFYGTFLGDYFGILMDEKVTGFPFSVVNDPMYWGSTLLFTGTAILYSSQAGLLLSLWVTFCYRIALLFEGPFTVKIYREKNEERKRL